MGNVLVYVKKAAFGEEWENVHSFRMNAADGTVSDADLTALGVGSPITTATTAAAAPTTVLQRLISFERWLHDDHVTITGVAVSDGKRNDTTGADYHWSSGLAIAGSGRTTQDPLNMALGLCALVINRIPIGFTSRMGRLFIRGILLDTEVAFNARGGVGWQATTAQTTMQTILATAITNSKIGDVLSGGSQVATALYCVPHFTPKSAISPTNPAGTLVGGDAVVTFAVGSPRGRQMLRGKKKKKVAGVPA